ncbi:MAG TPA: CoA-transferase, partial [Bacteroidales bacterium]|nr:CoA-transferase [Bacteroidales bacterium]
TKHNTKTGEAKIVKNCSYPLTGKGVVNRIYTDLSILEVTEKGLKVIELAPGVSFEYLQSVTEAQIFQ